MLLFCLQRQQMPKPVYRTSQSAWLTCPGRLPLAASPPAFFLFFLKQPALLTPSFFPLYHSHPFTRPPRPTAQHFKNGGAGERVLNVGSALNADSGVMDWMLKNRKGSGKK